MAKTTKKPIKRVTIIIFAETVEEEEVLRLEQKNREMIKSHWKKIRKTKLQMN
jgi:precorrin-4 methylase